MGGEAGDGLDEVLRDVAWVCVTCQNRGEFMQGWRRCACVQDMFVIFSWELSFRAGKREMPPAVLIRSKRLQTPPIMSAWTFMVWET